jgi:hypothetical protein
MIFVQIIFHNLTPDGKKIRYSQDGCQKLFIIHGNHDDSFVEVIIQHIWMVFGYDLLCD